MVDKWCGLDGYQNDVSLATARDSDSESSSLLSSLSSSSWPHTVVVSEHRRDSCTISQCLHLFVSSSSLLSVLPLFFSPRTHPCWYFSSSSRASHASNGSFHFSTPLLTHPRLALTPIFKNHRGISNVISPVDCPRKVASFLASR